MRRNLKKLNSRISQISDLLLAALLPYHSTISEKQARKKLSLLIKSSLKFIYASDKRLEEHLVSSLATIQKQIIQDAQAVLDSDPAASDLDLVLLCYPGIFAMTHYRFAHLLTNHQIPYLPRLLTEYAHRQTGIDIHPNAKIGSHFAIDHGSGIVIGETSVIGNHVKIYQGVTLGGIVVKRALKGAKRHPTIEDNVTIYSNASILGGDTVVGRDSIIGGNVCLTKSVPANAVVASVKKIIIKKRGGES
jgi:serine O-acetyltransferase